MPSSGLRNKERLCYNTISAMTREEQVLREIFLERMTDLYSKSRTDLSRIRWVGEDGRGLYATPCHLL